MDKEISVKQKINQLINLLCNPYESHSLLPDFFLLLQPFPVLVDQGG